MKKIDKKQAALVNQVLFEIIDSLGEAVKSFTPDRGKEFSAYQELIEETGIPFYFPDAYSPWQRGTNENTNGLIREYLPKHHEMDSVSEELISQIAKKLNLRPRKCLNWKTPYEVFFNQSLHLT
jgi:IS30 family transposase